MRDFSHLDDAGQPQMVNVSKKQSTDRMASAQAIVQLPESIAEQLKKEDIRTKKGSVIQTAILAGIMGAKKTGELIPLCHPLPLEDCRLDIVLNSQNQLVINGETRIHGKTGVEMEALTAVSIAALTVYDMCKALSKDIIIKEIRLLSKSGGKSDFKH